MTDVAVVGVGVASPVLCHPRDLLGEPVSSTTGSEPPSGRGMRYKDRSTRWGLLAVTRALQDASLLDGDAPGPGMVADAARTGVVASSNLGNLDTVCLTAEVIASRSSAATSPMDLPNASSNIIASSIAVRFGLRGPNVMMCNGASSGLDAVYLAAMLIASGRANRTVVVGVEPANEVVAALVGKPVGELFDGAAAVLLERAGSARARGARPRAVVGGFARRTSAERSVVRALVDRPPPRLWLVEGVTQVPPALRGVPRRDLEATLGVASGALGVLQIVAAVHLLADGLSGPVLASAGAVEDGTSSLLLTPPGRQP